MKTKFVILSRARRAQSKDLLFASIATTLIACVGLLCPSSARAQSEAHPGARTVMDAHNCYPYYEWWSDRIDRALSAGTPLAIEQDLGWYTDKKTGKSWSIVTHSAEGSGHEPTMKQYFFERVRQMSFDLRPAALDHLGDGGRIALKGWVHGRAPAPAAALSGSSRNAVTASSMSSRCTSRLTSRPMTRSTTSMTTSPMRLAASSTAR